MAVGSTAETRDLFDLHGRVALITGAAMGGLGAAAARTLGSRGATIVVTDLEDRRDDLGRTTDELRADGIEVGAAPLDVTDEVAVGSVVDRIEAETGGIDILVHTAGVMLRRPMAEMSLADWDHVMRVNVTGTWLTNRAVAPRMAGRGWGRIINYSTVYAERVGMLPESAYYASKAAVANLTRAVAAEYGEQGVTVNCLAPGVFYPTRMTAPLADDPTALERMTHRTLLKRLGDPARDLDGPLVLLASAASDYVTGQVVYVDGGWSAW